MKLFVNTIEFGIIELLVRNDENIKEIKENIYGKIGLNVNLLNLYYNGEILEDDKTLNKYEIINNSVINIVNKLRGGMRIFVENNEKIFAFEIEENEKIINAKLKIFESLRIDVNYFYLIYNDKIFDGDESLIEFGILNKSLINVVRNKLHIFAKTKNGQTYVIEVVYSENIIDLKRKIQEQIGLHPDKQKLIYLTNLLDDDKTIDEYQIFDRSVINIIDRLEDEMQIFAKTIDGRTIIFEVQKSDKIIDIKYKIQDKIGLSTDLQQLIYQDKILSDDDKTIDQYQIVDKSVINIIAKLNFIQIFAKTMDGETVKFKTCESEKIIDLKKKIEEKLKFHRNRQILIYNCIILEDDKTIDQYQIHDNSVIDIINKSKIKIIINLEIFDGRKFKLCAEKQTKIIDIKKQIEMLIDLDPTKQNLYYQDVLLEGNEDTLEDIQASLKGASHTINKKMPFIKRLFKPKKLQPSKDVMTISVEMSNDWLKIFVETTNQIQYKLCVKKYETILDVKNKFHTLVKVEPNEQILFFNQSILENDKTVEQSNIVDKSVLHVEFNLKDWINIYMNILNGNRNMGKLDLMTTDKLGDLKCDIEEKIGINRDAQILVYNGEILLDDDKTVNQYQITNYSIIDIKLRSEYTIECDEEEYVNMGNIKKIIKNRKQINKEQKIVLYSSNFNNNKLIFEYEIKKKEVRKVNNKLKKFIEAIKSKSIGDVQMCYEKSILEMKYGSYFRHPIHYACKYGLEDIVKYLIKEGCNLEASDSENRRPIHYVCAAGNAKLLNILIQNKVNIDASDFLNRRPIHYTCFNGNLNIVKILIENKCDKEARDYKNRRPIHYSCSNGHVEIIEFLIEINCDIESLDDSNRSPLEIAQENNSEKVVDILNKELRTRINIQRIVEVMELECIGDDCDHEFCKSSFLSKEFIKNKQINEENFGNVYHCKESLTGRKFVYKKFYNESLSSKYIEGDINDFIETLRYERIIKYFGNFEIKQYRFVLMEFIETLSIKERIQSQISTNSVVRFTKQLLEALGFLHENRIIHRDINPANIFVDDQENVKLANFEFSLLSDRIENENTKTNRFCGTIYYVAPEIICRDLFSYSVDVWSLGITVYEMATQETPFRNMNYQQIINSISELKEIENNFPDTSLYFHHLKTVIDKMLKINLEERSSASKLLKEIDVYLPKSVYQY